MMERDCGHGAYGGPRSEAANGGPRSEGASGGPRSEGASGGLKSEAAYGGPKTETAYGGPKTETAYGGPKTETAYGGPRGEAAFGGGPRGEAALGGDPRGEAGGLSGKSTNRFGPYESYDSRSSLGGSDLYRSGHGYNEPEPSRRNSLDSFGGRNQGGASWEASLAHAKMRTGFMDESGRESYSSYSGVASPPMRPAAAGSRGRGMPSFPEGALGSRSFEAFGGMPAGRGMGLGGMQRPVIVIDYHNKSAFGAPPSGPAGYGTKRKMMPPPNKPVTGALANKKTKLAEYREKTNKKTDAKKKKKKEKQRVEARRRKQRHRRVKSSEKYGDGFRILFACAFCKFQTYEEKDIEAHLASTSHQETLKHIQEQTKFDKVIMEFLHESMVNKFKKTSLRKAQTNQPEAANIAEKDMLEGVSSDEHLMKLETVHCRACSVYVPALHSSVQQHINSSDHAKCKRAYKEKIKSESVLIATSLFNNPIVKARYEKFAKGENPFDITEILDENTANVEDAAEVNENESNVENEEDEDSEEEAEETNKV